MSWKGTSVIAASQVMFVLYVHNNKTAFAIKCCSISNVALPNALTANVKDNIDTSDIT